jgi:hypothetical protein
VHADAWRRKAAWPSGHQRNVGGVSPQQGNTRRVFVAGKKAPILTFIQKNIHELLLRLGTAAEFDLFEREC